MSKCSVHQQLKHRFGALKRVCSHRQESEHRHVSCTGDSWTHVEGWGNWAGTGPSSESSNPRAKMRLDRHRERPSRGGETRPVSCESRKIHISKTIWSRCQTKDGQSEDYVPTGFANWVVCNFHFTGVGKNRRGWRTDEKGMKRQCTSLCSKSMAIKRRSERCWQGLRLGEECTFSAFSFFTWLRANETLRARTAFSILIASTRLYKKKSSTTKSLFRMQDIYISCTSLNFN